MKNAIKIGAIGAFGMFSVCVGAGVGASEIIKYFYDKTDYKSACEALRYVQETWREFPVLITKRVLEREVIDKELAKYEKG